MRTADDAVSLKLVHRETGQPATAQQKRADWAAVSAQPKAKRAAFYKKFTQLEMPPEEIDKQVTRLIGEFSDILRKQFTSFDSFPTKAQIGTLDMIYALGPKGLFNGFPKFCAAVSEGKWTIAAEECHRGGVSDSRNADCRQLFLDAAAEPVLESAPVLAFAPATAKKTPRKSA